MKKTNRPYNEFEETELWKTLVKVLIDLVKNKDMQLTTPKEYVIGYICKILTPNLKRFSYHSQ